MENKNLAFFNKEGFQMNMNYDSTSDIYNAKIYLDKNSTDTYKTQGIYLFEKVDGSNNTFNVTLEKFQLFNTNGFNTFPKYEALPLSISNIVLENISSTYNTKWVYATDIEKSFYPGMYCYFENLETYLNNDFKTYISSELQVRKVMQVEKGRILIYTETTNDNALPIHIFSLNEKIVPINIIEIKQNNEPIWNETLFTSKLYPQKKISYITNTDNSGIYTLNDVCVENTKYFYVIPEVLTAYTPAIGDKLKIDISLRTSNIKINDGSITFNSSLNAIELGLNKIPSFLKVGDKLQAAEKISSIDVSNLVEFKVLSLDKTNNTIYIDPSLNSITFNQVIDCYLYLATNIFSIEQELLYDNDNVYSLPLTYWTIQNIYFEELSLLSGGFKLEYLSDTNELKIESNYIENYFDVNISIIDSSNVETDYSSDLVFDNYKIYSLNVIEDLLTEDEISKDSTLYNRNFVFTSIDTFGLNLQINGIDYNTDFDTDVNNTISDWILSHASNLSNLGIIATQIGLNKLNIQSEYANIPVFIISNLGDTTNYIVEYKDIVFSKIKSQLLITINDVNYLEPFQTSDIITVSNWITTYSEQLKLSGIYVSNILNTIKFGIKDPEKKLDIKYNIGYIPKSGDLSIIETFYANNSNGSMITGNEIHCNLGIYDFLNYYSTGQKISISESSYNLQNKHYNIIGLTENKICLSYQGLFWSESPAFDLNIISDYFIRFPKSGYTDTSNQSLLKFSWKETQSSEFFLYDFSGEQLKPYDSNFPDYSGIMPLCGDNAEIELKLISKPNQDINYITEPTKQQTVFDTIEYVLPYIDNNENSGLEPNPLQVFIGYNSQFESWNKARLYLDLIEDISFNLTDTSISLSILQDTWSFKDNYVEILNVSVPFSFVYLGFTKGQIVEFNSSDINSDNKQIATLLNSGIQYIISEVNAHKLTFTTNVIEETSYKTVARTYLPYYDNDGNQYTEQRHLNVSCKVMPKTIAYFDIYGESETEDERHKINLDNRNLNILKLQDFYIFKSVDIKEQGIDWIFLNRKRKELIEIYSEIFNNIGSYKSVIQAINFFGYNDLTFTEYFQNINPESSKFGQLMNMELLNIFNKSVDGYSYSNLAYENLRNEGYRKTNLFSLNYKITDMDGNFIDAYSLDEVKIKLLGLKKWLTENIIPIGTKIVDIDGKYELPHDFTIKHESYMTKTYLIEEYAAPIDFNVSGNLTPITSQSNTYDISVNFFSNQPIDFYQYKIRTFFVEQWTNVGYLINSKVLYNGIAYIANVQTVASDIPSLSTKWTKISIESISNVQLLSDYKYQEDSVSFTINSLVDPYFVIEVYYHSGYGISHKTEKSYSVPIVNSAQHA